VSWQPVSEERVSQFPFSLTTGRLRDQWHGMTRTGTAGRLFAHSPEPCVQINPQDALRLDLQDGELVQVRSKRGSLVLPVQASAQVAASQAFIAMHWGPEVLGGRGQERLDHVQLLPQLQAARAQTRCRANHTRRTVVP
jgi:assimilatory nitrate reductase catalytic subunit